ncbi:MAG: PTS sugar transporter subunit IIA [Coprobacillus sp.]
MEEMNSIDIALVDLSADCYETVIDKLGAELVKKGYVQPEYVTATIDREKLYPTGLNINGDIKTAIPHADCCYVNQAQIAFASLKEPVGFKNMEDPTSYIDVKVVFMLAVKDPSQQVEFLQKFMELFQDELLIKQLSKLKDVNQIKQIINKKIY